jgi:D-alanine-D-alanine ligase
VHKLLTGNFSAAFIALHGTFGEDGTLQGLLESIKLPYIGSGVLASALAMDKIRSKRIWQTMGIPTLPFATWQHEQDLSYFIEQFNFPLVVKPSCQGSSLGTYKTNNMIEFTTALNNASVYGDVIIEPWITGEEYAVSILGDKTLPSIKIVPSMNFYDYDAKYLSDSTRYICPSQLDYKEEKYLNTICNDAFDALGCSDFGRVDVMRDAKGEFWILEVNTLPGLTDHSLLPKSAQAVGISYTDLIVEILQLAKLKSVFAKSAAYHEI